MTSPDDPRSFEQHLEQIEEIVAELESGTLSLDDMLEHYESGMRLIATCQQRLSTAELKVTEVANVASVSQNATNLGAPDADE